MRELAHSVVDSYAAGPTTELANLFGTIENVLQNTDPDLEALISIGLFEDMQNIASHRESGSAPFRELLGKRSLVLWDRVDEGMPKVAEWTEKQKPRWWHFGESVGHAMSKKRCPKWKAGAPENSRSGIQRKR